MRSWMWPRWSRSYLFIRDVQEQHVPEWETGWKHLQMQMRCSVLLYLVSCQEAIILLLLLRHSMRRLIRAERYMSLIPVPQDLR